MPSEEFPVSGTKNHRWLRHGRDYTGPFIRAIGGALALSALLLTLLPSAASAASFNPKLGVNIGNCSVYGWDAGSKKTVVLTWKDSDGNLKNKQTVKSDSSGNFDSNCDYTENIEFGDTFQVAIGTSSRTLTIPKLTIVVDRVSDSVSGKGPASDAVDITACGDSGCYSATEPTNGAGAYAHNFSGDTNITGTGYGWVDWYSAQGDYVENNADAQQLQIWEGRTGSSLSYWVSGAPGQQFTVHLLNGSLTEIGSSVAFLDQWGTYRNDILDADGARVFAHAGDTVDATGLASDAHFVLPAISVAGNVKTNKVSGTCLPNSPYSFEAYATDYSRDANFNGTTTGAGSFSVKITSQMKLKHGDHVDVYCTMSTGDQVAKHITVP